LIVQRYKLYFERARAYPKKNKKSCKNQRFSAKSGHFILFFGDIVVKIRIRSNQFAVVAYRYLFNQKIIKLWVILHQPYK
jgi:hypothetical protein